MNIIIFLVVGSALLGLVLGSFAGATVWRLRARQLVADKKSGEPYSTAELKRLKMLTTATVANDRSRCLHCGHALAWYDLVPLVSWLSTNGACRYCKKPIGWFEPLIELSTAALFAITAYWWLHIGGLQPLSLAILALLLVINVMFVILFAYDQKWFLLPDSVVFPLIATSAVAAVLIYISTQPHELGYYLLSTAGSVVVLSGLYLGLWLLSKGVWVGFGDVKLGIALGILLADWQLALLTLFLANLIGTLLVLPGLVRGRLNRETQVPFGPLLIAGFYISLFFGAQLIQGYYVFSEWLASLLLML